MKCFYAMDSIIPGSHYRQYRNKRCLHAWAVHVLASVARAPNLLASTTASTTDLHVRENKTTTNFSSALAIESQPENKPPAPALLDPPAI